MAFPTNAEANATTAADRLIQLAKAVRSDAVKYIAQCDASAVNAHDLIGAFVVNHLVPVSALWASLRVVSGVPAIIRQRFPGAFADDAAVTTDLTAAQTAIDATIANVVASTPVDGNGWTLTLKVVSGVFVQRVVVAAGPIATLRAQIVLLRDAFTA